jgi:cytochrome c oxidase assembly protein subunit 15
MAFTASPKNVSHQTRIPVWLKHLTKVTCFSTIFLIFAGGMVTSTGSGLSVPDWPLSYGTFFPPMVGGVFYEHGHRMIASSVGLLTLIQAISLAIYERRIWVRNLGFLALGAVILQGILGGLTVLFYLPAPISVSHAILAQTFFLLTIMIAYSQSDERQKRESQKDMPKPTFLKSILLFIVIIYIQLTLGAIMRHTESGLAIYDFPTMGGEWFPRFDQTMLNNINAWRFEHDLPYVTMPQVVYHFLHRIGALLVLSGLTLVTIIGFKQYQSASLVRTTLKFLVFTVLMQVILGILTVLTGKSPILTSIHVVTGAGILGLTLFLFLRSAPLQLNELKMSLK